MRHQTRIFVCALFGFEKDNGRRLKAIILSQGALLPCTHALLAKWSPPSERGRMAVYAYTGMFYICIMQIDSPLGAALFALLLAAINRAGAREFHNARTRLRRLSIIIYRFSAAGAQSQRDLIRPATRSDITSTKCMGCRFQLRKSQLNLWALCEIKVTSKTYVSFMKCVEKRSLRFFTGFFPVELDFPTRYLLQK